MDNSRDTKELYFSTSINEVAEDAEALAELRFHEHDPSTLSVRLHLLGSEARRTQTFTKLDDLKRNHLTLNPEPPAHKIVEVLGIGGMEFIGSPVQSVTIKCASVEVGILASSLTTEAERYHVTAQIVPSGILTQPSVMSFYPSGEVKRERGQDHEILVPVTNGMVNALAVYERATGEEFGNAVTKLIQRTIVTGEIHRKGETTLAQVHEQFRTDLDDVCRVLSLCYRWSVTFYEIEYFDATRPPVDVAYLRRAVRAPKRNKLSGVELLFIGSLVDGGLGELVTALRSATMHDDLGRAINYLAQSYAADRLENSYFAAFSAFETAVAAAEGKKVYALGSSRWERLKDRLTTAMDAFVAEERVDPREAADLLEALQEKLPELRRVSLRRQIAALVKKLEIDVDYLWLPEVGFEEGIRRATASRNQLFHAAKLTDAETLHSDLVRVQLLTERIILKLLKWPDSKIWDRHNEAVRWANRGERERAAHAPPSSA
jgi:hypothetical protein